MARVEHHLPTTFSKIEADVHVQSDVLDTVTNVDGKSIESENIIKEANIMVVMGCTFFTICQS